MKDNMKLTENQIEEITDEIESGMNVYINRDTLEFISIPDWDEFIGDTEYWEEEQKKIDSDWTDYFIIRKLESWEAFEIMEDFVREVSDLDMVEKLAGTLSRKHPFANFKLRVESSVYREQWFEFRRNAYMKHVRKQIGDGFMDADEFDSD
jgi:hypothetical protein